MCRFDLLAFFSLVLIAVAPACGRASSGSDANTLTSRANDHDEAIHVLVPSSGEAMPPASTSDWGAPKPANSHVSYARGGLVGSPRVYNIGCGYWECYDSGYQG